MLFLLPYSICVEATGAKVLCCYSWEAREQICGGPGAASSCWHEDAALYIAVTDHWSVTIPTSLQSLPLIVTNPLRCSSGLFLCRGFWTLWGCILAPFASVRLCCCSAATPTSQPAATLLVYGWMCWSLAEMEEWACVVVIYGPVALPRTDHRQYRGHPTTARPHPAWTLPWRTHPGWERGGCFLFFFPVTLFYHHLLLMSCVILHVHLSLGFIGQIKLYCCHLWI